MTSTLKQSIAKLVLDAALSLPDVQALPDAGKLDPEIERTRDPSHGDFATNLALRLARPLSASPRDIATRIVAALTDTELVDDVSIAGPGFINFRLSPQAFDAETARILELGPEYGTSKSGADRRVLVEFVSANPTGPLHVGHGRHAAYGDSVSKLLAATGHRVEREYYVNDAGRQIEILALSVLLRLLEKNGSEVVFPAGGYKGAYIEEIADRLAKLAAETLPDGPPGGFLESLDDDADADVDARISAARQWLGQEAFQALGSEAVADILGDIRDDLAGFGVHPDTWFSERSLATDGAIEKSLKLIADRGISYEKDGATWFRATDFGDEKDRVVVRDDGRTTYFASDIAYHLEKRERGFDQLIDVLGSDHHGYVARVRAGLEAMGESPDCLEVQLVQFVVLYRGGEKVQMSTRSGDFVPLRDLRSEVGNDAARFFYIMRSNEQHLDFDLDLAKSRSNDNPVYYIQYAHARVSSVFRELEARQLEWNRNDGEAGLGRLTEPQERSLMQALSRYPEVVELAARQRAPQHVAHYLRELAQEFHACYNAHRYIVDDAELRNARLTLAVAARQVIRNGLGMLGVSAPDTM